VWLRSIRLPRLGAVLGALALAAVPVAAAVPGQRPAMSTVAGLATTPAVEAGATARCGQPVTLPLPEPDWALTRLRPDLAWPLSRGAGVTVAVIDSGVSPDHPALAGKVLPGRDLVVEAGEAQAVAGVTLGQCDEVGHGTVVAGIIAGREETSAGYTFSGIAPDATILPVRVLRDQTPDANADMATRIATAVNWAVGQGAKVINMSLTTGPSPQLADAIAHALASGVVVVAAAGNSGTDATAAVTYPAAYDGVIGVGGVDDKDQHVDSSTVGNWVDVAAPGVRISGPAVAGGGYVYAESGGTSFATAYVSGVAALICAHDPTLSAAQVAERITATADHPPQGWNAEVGYGVVNPARAVGALDPGAAVPSEPAGQVSPLVAPATSHDAVSTAAPWVAGAAAMVALGVLVAVPVTRRGRERGWRASTRPAPGRRGAGAGIATRQESTVGSRRP
jgi:type VII secretion-associated serine protease mycosin